MKFLNRSKRTVEKMEKNQIESSNESANNSSDNSKGKKRKIKKKSKEKLKKGQIIQALNLEEAVPSMILGELEEYAENFDGAVYPTDKGYTVLIIRNEVLEKSSINDDPDDNVVGQLSLAIQGDSIRSATRLGDKDNEQLVIIPNFETLEAMQTFDIFSETVTIVDSDGNAHEEGILAWGEFERDALDSDDLAHSKIFPSNNLLKGFTLEELMAVVDDDDVATIDIETGNPLTQEQIDNMSNGSSNEQAPVEEELYDDVEPTPVEEAPIEDNTEQAPIEQTNIEQSPVEEVNPIEEAPIEDDFKQPSVEEQYGADENEPFNDSFNEYNNEYNYTPQQDDVDVYSTTQLEQLRQFSNEENSALTDNANNDVVYPTVSSNDYIASVISLENRLVTDMDIELEIDTQPINELFLSTSPFYFSTSPNDENSLLTETLNAKRKQFNDTLARNHELNLQKLAETFMTEMASGIEKIQKHLDDSNAETPIGQERDQIETNYHEELSLSKELSENEKDTLREAYNKEKQKYVETRIEQAKAEYDLKNLEAHKLQLSKVTDNVRSYITENYKTSISKLNAKRQKMALHGLNTFQTQTVERIQKMYESIMVAEEEMRSEMVAELNAYLEDNFKDETLQAEALLEQKRQESDASRVRREFEVKLAENEDYIKNLKAKNNREREDLDREYQLAIKKMLNEHNDVLMRKDETIEKLNSKHEQMEKELLSLREELITTSEVSRKEAEEKANDSYVTRINHLTGVIENQKDMLRSVDEDKKKSRFKNLLGYVAVAVCTLGLGTSATVAYMTTHDEPQQQAVTPSETASNVTEDNNTVAESNTAETAEKGDYVAKASGEGATGSLILEHQDEYKRGDKINVLGAMSSEDNDVKKVIVTSVKDDSVTVKTTDKHEYAFTMIK